MQRKTPEVQASAKLARVPTQGEGLEGQPPTKRGTHEAAIEQLIEPMRNGEGQRLCFIGASRKGKTAFAIKLARAMQAEGLAKSIIIVDHKWADKQQYEGTAVTSLAQLRQAYIAGSPTIVCRPGCSVEDAASLVKDAALMKRERCVLIIDEMMPALRVNEDTGEVQDQIWSGPSPLWICLQGGGLGASIIQLVQLPKQVPTSLLDQAQAFVVFACGGRTRRYALRLELFERDVALAAKTYQPGELALMWTDQDWDGVTYYSPEASG